MDEVILEICDASISQVLGTSTSALPGFFVAPSGSLYKKEFRLENWFVSSDR